MPRYPQFRSIGKASRLRGLTPGSTGVFGTAVVTLLMLVFAATALAEKPRIEIQTQPPKESCNLSAVAYDWDFSTSSHGFTTSMCDTDGYPVWQYGDTGIIPDVPPMVWGTVLDTDYPSDAGEALISPIWTVGSDSYLLEVTHYFDIESGYDGGNVKINGQVVEPTGGYPGTISENTSYYAWCVDEQPGFTGNDATWRTDCFDISPWWGEDVSVQFEFGSDSSVTYPGWYLASVRVGSSGPRTLVVLPDGSGDYPTIQSAIDAAAPGDTVELGEGMYTGDGNRDLDFRGKAITVRSQSGDPAHCTINCEGYENDPHVGFIFHSDEGSDSILEGVSIIQGFYTSLDGNIFLLADAGGITCDNASPTVRDCVISFNTASLQRGSFAQTGPAAAGVSCRYASPVFQNCEIISNYLLVEGIASDQYTGYINPFAAGVACFESSPTFENCTIASNDSEISATPITLPDPPSLEVVIAGGLASFGDYFGEVAAVNYCSVQGNSVVVNLAETPDSEILQISIAGGMAVVGVEPTEWDLPSPVFIENTVTINGLAGYPGNLIAAGGMTCSGVSEDLVSPTFQGNSVTIAGEFPTGLSPTIGGAIACNGSSLMSADGEFADNLVSNLPLPIPYPRPEAGAIALYGSTAEMDNCTFTGNRFDLSGGPVDIDSIFGAGGVALIETYANLTGCDFTGNEFVQEELLPLLTVNFFAAAGAVLQSDGEVLLTECVFDQNAATVVGSGVFAIAAGAVTDPVTVTMGELCSFTGNIASVAGIFEEAIVGGAASFGVLSHPTLESCGFAFNEAKAGSLSSGGAVDAATVGGGVACATNDLVINDCIFTENIGSVEAATSLSLAGGMACLQSSPQISSSLFRGNQVSATPITLPSEPPIAGGLALLHSSASVSSCTFEGNLVPDAGRKSLAGGISVAGNSSPVFSNDIIAFSPVGVGIACDEVGTVTLTCCDVYGNGGGDWVGCIEDQLGVEGNIHLDPLFCGELNPEMPFSLASSSPCAPEINPDCGLIGALPVGCTASGIQDPEQIPTVLRLHQCYPNPFNPQTTISFTLPNGGWAEIAIYDLTGRCIDVLMDRTFAVGTHNLSWNGRDSRNRGVPSGTYVVRLETESGVEARKVMLLR